MQRDIYRIIDANFNRAREAIRVIEEFCRFALNSEPLTERAKQLRHQLSACLAKLNATQLIISRDTPGDVGAGKTVSNQLGRAGLKDCFTAGCKRLTEALRTLTEMIQTFDPTLAQQVEELRYLAYTLEKDIVVFSDTAERFKNVKLYVIITDSRPAEVRRLTQYCIAGGADCIQLRAKAVDDDKLFALASEFIKICKEAGILSVINDRLDIAVTCQADGVHLGQNDLPVEQARKLQLKPLIIGLSTHSPQQLRNARNQQPTYVSLGPVFTTDTKPASKAVGLKYVTESMGILDGTGIGHVAIGGITLDNLESVLQAGAETIAVCSAITEAADPVAACCAFKEKIVAFVRD